MVACAARVMPLAARAAPAASTSRPAAPVRGGQLSPSRALLEERRQAEAGQREAEQPLVVCLPLRHRSDLRAYDPLAPALPLALHALRAAAPPAEGALPAEASCDWAADQPYFQVQVNDPPPQQQEQRSDKGSDYYANVGDAIRTLREDIPLMFFRELNWSIYREDIAFRDPNLMFRGLKNYKLIFWSLRFHGRLFFKNPYVEVLRIWQPEDHQIKMRWKMHAVPRVWWEAEGTFDGISTYKLDRTGKIYEHYVDNVQLRDPPITNPLLYGLNYILSPRLNPQQVPCPGSWFTEHEAGSAAADVFGSVDLPQCSIGDAALDV